MDDKGTAHSETKPASTTHKTAMLNKTAAPQQPLDQTAQAGEGAVPAEMSGRGQEKPDWRHSTI